MESKSLYYIAVAIGSLAGAYLPLIWGGSTFSMSSILLSGVGGAFGIYLVYKHSN